jgi:hypothetical protein
MAGYFSADRATIKSILDRELSLRKFTRRWVPHILSAEQKLRRVTESQSLLTILTNLAEKTFRGSLQGPEEILRAIQVSMVSLHFRRLPKCLQVVDGATNLGDCKQWRVLSLKKAV